MTLIDMMEQDRLQKESSLLFKYSEGDTELRLSHGEFRSRAYAIAAHLAEVGSPGEPVLLVFPPGPEFLCAFMGAISAGMIAVPVYPPDARPASLRRFLALIEDAGPRVALGTSEVVRQVQMLPPLAKMNWIATNTISAEDAARYRRPTVRDQDIAFLQYTSGSTGIPRGVMHTHRNVLANMDLIRDTLHIDGASHGVIWLPLYHDMGLITSLMAIRHGSSMSLMSPLVFLRKPIDWLRAITSERATHAGGPNFAYDYCVRKATDADCAALDLSTWTHAFNGAEPVRHETMERFARKFESAGFRKSAFMPCYGLAEATLLVSVGPSGQGPLCKRVDATALGRARVTEPSGSGPTRDLVASGLVHDRAEVRIVDPVTLRRSDDTQVGEIWVRGPGLGRGYWKRPEDSERLFAARIQPDNDGPFLRTGDLGFIADGQLYVTGRLKDLIVVRGENYYPQDIEAIVCDAHQAVRPGCAIALALPGGETEELAVFFEVDNGATKDPALSQVIQQVREAVSEQLGLAPQLVVALAKNVLPKTSSGKVQRAPCREAFLANELPILGRHDGRRAAEPKEAQPVSLAGAVEARLIAEIAQVVDVPVGRDSVVTRIGINSVTAIEVMFAVEQEFGLAIAPQHLTDSITIAQLAERIVQGEAPSLPTSRAPEPRPAQPSASGRLDVSLMYFSTDTLSTEARYDILLRSARFADEHGFKALWLPERHFHAFGGTYPNPAVAAAALAVTTKQIRLRAGSVVLPLHSPLRVVEDWSLVDNLSKGRVDLSFATGWNPNDFVIAPDKFDSRRTITLAGIEEIEALWSGAAIELPNGRQQATKISTHPRPVQPTLDVWMTCTANVDGFVEAGRRGYNVLTALLFQRVEEVAPKLRQYREARARHGHDPNAGQVCLMLHTFLGGSVEAVHRKVAGPFKRYLASSIDLWKEEWPDIAPGNNGAVSDHLLEMAFQRYAHGNALFGTVASVSPLVAELRSIGVNEIACLVDFGLAADEVLGSLVYLDDLRALCANDRSEAVSAQPQVVTTY